MTSAPPPVLLTSSTTVLGGELGEMSLTAAELRRADAHRHEDDRADFVAAHFLVRVCAARLLRAATASHTVVQECDKCGGPHGRPRLDGHPEVHLSLSHTRGVVAAAAGYGPVGIDVERISAGDTHAAPSEWALTPQEAEATRRAPHPYHAYLRQWGRKEAFIKVGAATMATLAGFDLSGLPLHDEPGSAVRLSRLRQWHVLDWTGTIPGTIGAAVATEPPRFSTIARPAEIEEPRP